MPTKLNVQKKFQINVYPKGYFEKILLVNYEVANCRFVPSFGSSFVQLTFLHSGLALNRFALLLERFRFPLPDGLALGP